MSPAIAALRTALRRQASAWIAIVLSCLSPVAFAADPEPAAPSLPIDSEHSAVQRPLWELGVGLAGLRVPDYRGSDQSSSYLLPLPYIVYRGKFLRADKDGARAVIVDAPRFEIDLSLSASAPTRNDNDARSGMPDLKPIVEFGPNATISLFRSDDRRFKLDLRLPLRAAFTVERSPRMIGTTFSPNLNLDVAKVAGGWNLGLLAGPLYGDRRYHRYYYGVDAGQATALRPAYRAQGGYAGWQAIAAASQRFGNAWVGAFVRYDSVRGAVFEDSPLVRRNSGITIGLGVSWVLARSSELVTSSD